MPLSNYALDYLVAPKLSQLSECNALDITELDYYSESEYFTLNFITNSLFAGKLIEQPKSEVKAESNENERVQDRLHAFLFNFLRKTQRAISEYCMGRSKLKEYLDVQSEQKISTYLKALSHFEVFLSQSAHAYEILEKLIREKNDLDIKEVIVFLDKVSRFYNYSKHAGKQISNNSYPENGTLTLWLTNNGFEVYNFRTKKEELLSWSDVKDTLDDLGTLAQLLQAVPHSVRAHKSS